MLKPTYNLPADPWQGDLLEAFVAAVRGTLLQMTGLELEVGELRQEMNLRSFGDISAVLGLTAPSEGAIVLSFSESAARSVAQALLGEIGVSPDASLVRDSVGEVANIVAGQAKGALAGTPYHFVYSPPMVVSGPGHEVQHRPDAPCLLLEFTSMAGGVQLQLSLTAAPRG